MSTKKRTRKATTSINPAENATPVAPAQPQATESGAETKRNRTPMLPCADGSKPARGLQWPFVAGSVAEWQWADLAVVEGRAKYRLGARQFAAEHHYYLYMAAKAQHMAELYTAHAAHLEANPRTRASASGLRTKVDKLTALLAEKLGCTVEEVLAQLDN